VTGWLQDLAYTKIPAADPHQIAWHRFCLPNLSWDSPKQIEIAAIESLRAQEVRRSLFAVRWKRREISGHIYVRIDDYANWDSRKLKGRLNDATESGIRFAKWNSDVAKSFSYFDEPTTEVRPFCGAIDKHSIPTLDNSVIVLPSDFECDSDLSARQAAVLELLTIAFATPTGSKQTSPFSRTQWKIYSLLTENFCLTASQIARRLELSERTIFNAMPDLRRGYASRQPIISVLGEGGGYVLTSRLMERHRELQAMS
jgi:DNA-binding CsgD family transcriptional regulator